MHIRYSLVGWNICPVHVGAIKHAWNPFCTVNVGCNWYAWNFLWNAHVLVQDMSNELYLYWYRVCALSFKRITKGNIQISFDRAITVKVTYSVYAGYMYCIRIGQLFSSDGHIIKWYFSHESSSLFVGSLECYSMHSLMSASHNLQSPANSRDAYVNAKCAHELVLDFTQVNARLIQNRSEYRHLFKFSKQKRWPMSTFAWHDVSCDLKTSDVSPDCAFRDTKQHSDFGIRPIVCQVWPDYPPP